MTGETESIVVPFLGALQASIAVLLTIAVGVIAAQFDLLSERSSKDVSKFCVRLALPALLIVNVGEQLHADTGARYIPIIIWALIYNIISMLFGFAVTKSFGMPDWTTPAIAFNNTTSLPLLLVQSLDATGILASIDPSSDVIDRAKSYFLVNAMIGNSLTFALGPKLLNGQEEDAPQEKDDDNDIDDATEAQLEHEAETTNEQTSLLPNRLAHGEARLQITLPHRISHALHRLPQPVQSALEFTYQFINPPLIGAALGALIGLTPQLHTLFFATQENGGYLNAWLTSSIRNIGSLFAALQVVVVGVKLSRSLLRMKKGEANGHVPWIPMVTITTVRFVVWPAISIGCIYALATRTGVLGDDPVLWFAMMLMPVGPPALKLTALADVNGAGEEEKMCIAKFLTISYAISPLICFSVVGALKASQAAVG